MDDLVTRLERSVLSVPASNWRMIEKAVALPADTVLLDLEDSVVPSEKVASRKNVIRAIRELDWGNKAPAYRVNGLDTPFCYRDLIEVVEEVGNAVRMVVIPKVDGPEELFMVDILLRQIERAVGIEPGDIGVAVQIESAIGLVNVDRTAAVSPRVQSLIFGPGDYAASVHMPVTSIGSRDRWDEHYPGHRFHYAMARIVVAARSTGRRAIDGPLADFRDLDAFRAACVVARGLGYDGKWCIHPSQIAIANEIFSPTVEEIAWARKVVDAYREAVATGRGALSVDDRMVDAASIKMAETTLDLARRAGILDGELETVAIPLTLSHKGGWGGSPRTAPPEDS